MWVSPNANLFYGWNFADNDDNSIDTDGHGSHVAGTRANASYGSVAATDIILSLS